MFRLSSVSVLSVGVLVAAGVALVPTLASATPRPAGTTSAAATTGTLRYSASQQAIRRGPTASLARATSHARADGSAGLTPIPGEHYIVTDPDNNSVFSPGGSHASSARLPGAVGDHAVAATPTPGTIGFVGITGPTQAKANSGGDLEPPDQGLCTDGSTILEFVNNALQAFSTSGEALSDPIASPSLFGLPADTFMADPRCYFDAATKRWFLTEFDIGTTNSNGVETSPSVQFVAVSDSPDPLGSYHTFSIDTTDTTISGCPCFGDFDQIGADANGFYISTNEFGVSSGAYNGSIVYAIDKHALEHSGDLGATAPTLVTYRLLDDAFGQPYHVAPAQTPPNAAFAHNREYFVESNSNANTDDHLLVYTMQDTAALAAGGTPTLTTTEITSKPYAFPPAANQKKGNIPLGDSVGDREAKLQADFNAIQEVTYANGRLYAELDTAVTGGKDGIGWYILTTTPTGPTTTVAIARQGYVTSPGTNLLYPVIAVNADGVGYLAFSLAGAGSYPSAADIRFGRNGPTGSISTAAAGAGPEDGFTCYAAFVGPGYGGCRWGDYSMGVAAGGRIFMATEYIAPTSRDYFTNWATYVWSAPDAG